MQIMAADREGYISELICDVRKLSSNASHIYTKAQPGQWYGREVLKKYVISFLSIRQAPLIYNTYKLRID